MRFQVFLNLNNSSNDDSGNFYITMSLVYSLSWKYYIIWKRALMEQSPVKLGIFCQALEVFSLHFSSAGKGPFMAGKANKCMPEAHFPGGKWSEGHSSVKCHSLLLRLILRKTAVVIFRQC